MKGTSIKPLLLWSLGILLVGCSRAGRGWEGPTKIAFEETTEAAGIGYEGLSWGLAWGDGNGDGAPDLWSSNHGSHPTLYMNLRNGTFLPVRRPYLQPTPGDSHGVSWADFNGDGTEDLIELTGAQRGVGTGKNHFYVNENNALVDRAEELGLDYPLGRGRMPLWLDWNLDGKLDVLLTNASREEAPNAVFLQNNGKFNRSDTPFGILHSEFAQLTALGGEDRLHVVVHGHKYPQVVYDLSTSPPTDVTDALALPLSYAGDVAFADFDGDGHTDYFVAQGRLGCELRLIDDHFMRAKIVVRHDVRGLTFRCDGPIEIRTRPTYVDWWPVSTVSVGEACIVPETNPFTVNAEEARGRWSESMVEGKEKGLFVLHDPDTGLWSVRMHGGVDEGSIEVRSDAVISEASRIGFHPYSPPRDVLACWRDGKYVDVGQSAGIGNTNSLSVVAGDFDNDMDIDLYVMVSFATEQHPNLFYENRGDGVFRSIVDGGAGGTLAGTSDSCAIADYDGDGFLDIAIGNGREISADGGPLQLFRNRGCDNHWLRLDLRGVRSNPEAIGARVTVKTGGVRQKRVVGAVMHRGAQNERTLHFGLGSHEKADRIHILWPSGKETVMQGVAGDRSLTITE
ncbi:MAG: hypothetical protein CMJ89_02000 [Planctomycetes bacterium]|jgi:hypothetical protein|nr:hypothetical protein [Planctomycetota bacterium]